MSQLSGRTAFCVWFGGDKSEDKVYNREGVESKNALPTPNLHAPESPFLLHETSDFSTMKKKISTYKVLFLGPLLGAGLQ